MSLAALKKTFFDGYLERHPEEATTLGRFEAAGRLRDHRPEALEEERRWYLEMDRALAAVEPDALSAADRIDHTVMKRLVDHHLHLWERLWCAVDWSMYPYNMVVAHQIHVVSDEDRRALTARLAEIPRFLSEHEANVERGIAAGILPDGALTTFFVEQQIPPASAHLRKQLAAQVGEAADKAADAYDAHAAWLRDKALPRSSAAKRLGEVELAWRWKHVMGIDRSPAACIAQAREELARVKVLLLECAAKVDGSVRDTAGVRALTTRMQQQTIASDAEVLPLYRDYVERARAHVEAKRLFRMPDGYAIGVDALPPGFAATGYNAQNWPAPLFDATKLGHFLVDPEAKGHRLAWAADLSVHEGLPGHHLQSFWWQRHFGADPAPVRFLVVHDQVAIARNFWTPMLNIEGWAVYAEELMRSTGFFTPPEELFVLMAHGVRAARVIADLSLHAGLMSEEEARAVLTDDLGVVEALAHSEVRRYLQIPLQASTYLLGRLGIEALVDERREREGDGFDLAAFHDRFFAFGPADPTSIRAAWDEAPTPARG